MEERPSTRALMQPPPALLRRLPTLLLALIGAIGPHPPAASGSPAVVAGGPPPFDPFLPGERWSHAADPAAPGVPRDVVLVGGTRGEGELVWAAPAGAFPRLLLLASSATDGAAPLLFEDDSVRDASGPIHVAAGDEASELFALAQYDDLPGVARRSVVTRHDAIAAATGSGFTPRWSRELAEGGNGGAYLAASADGAVLVAACFDAGAARVWVERIDPATGAPQASAGFSTLALRNLVVSADGTRIVLLGGQEARVLDGNLATLHLEPLVGAGAALAISADGTRLAVGEPTRVRLLREVGGIWSTLLSLDGATGEVATAAALSDDGGVLAVAWWNSRDMVSVRCEIRDVTLGTSRGTWSQTGVGAGVQNYPEALVLSPDGARCAVGTWGLGDAAAEVVLLDVAPGAAATPLLEIDLAGSAHALALDATGTRLAVAAKDAHANHFATSGTVRLFDTGERDLQLITAARVGGDLEVVSRHPGAVLTLFVLGDPLAAPLHLPPLVGELGVDPAAPWWLWSVPADAIGEARLTLAVPPDSAFAGLRPGLQSASFRGGVIELSRTLLRPSIL